MILVIQYLFISSPLVANNYSAPIWRNNSQILMCRYMLQALSVIFTSLFHSFNLPTMWNQACVVKNIWFNICFMFSSLILAFPSYLSMLAKNELSEIQLLWKWDDFRKCGQCICGINKITGAHRVSVVLLVSWRHFMQGRTRLSIGLSPPDCCVQKF